MVAVLTFGLSLSLALGQTASSIPTSSTSLTPPVAKLSRQSVHKLLSAIDAMSKKLETRSDKLMANLHNVGASIPELSDKDIETGHTIAAQHGFTLTDFMMQLSALVGTYLALAPDAFEQMLPTKNTPEIKQILTDPKTTSTQKKALHKKIKWAQENKDVLFRRMTTAATKHNRRIVRDLLPQIHAVFNRAKKRFSKST